MSSIHAKESIVSRKPIPLIESGDDFRPASEHAAERSRTTLPDELANGLVGASRLEDFAQVLEFMERLSRHSYGRVRGDHLSSCMRVCTITLASRLRLTEKSSFSSGGR